MKVAVVGGGIAGLSAALALGDGGAEATIFEASPRSGGKIATVTDEGFTAEGGPHALARSATFSWGLARRLGLEDEIARASSGGRFVWRGGRLLRAPSLGLLSRAGWGALLREPAWFRRDPGESGRSLRRFLVDHLGEEAGTLAARLMAAGVYAGDPDKLSARDAFPRLAALEDARGSLVVGALWGAVRGRRPGQPAEGRRRERPPAGLWSFERGLGALAGALEARLRARLRLGAPVQSLRPLGSNGASGSPGGSWQLEWGGPAAGSDRFDAIVLALPAFAAAPLCAPFSPSLAGLLAAVPYAPLAVVQLGVRAADLASPAKGFGLLDGDGTLSSAGILFPSSMFPGRAPPGTSLLSFMVGGALRPELAWLPDAPLIDLCRRDLIRTLGLRGSPIFARVVRHERAIPQYEIGHAARLRELFVAAAVHSHLVLCGAAYDGVSVDQCARGGARAATELMRAL